MLAPTSTPKRGVLPIMAYTGRLKLQQHERTGISLVEVYERVGKWVTSVCENAHRVYDCEKPRKRSGFLIISYLKDSAVIAPIPSRAFSNAQSVSGVALFSTD